eukprot:COSAG01_NODE_5483_length_4230_cov_17.465505_3_plen_71_part_00
MPPANAASLGLVESHELPRRSCSRDLPLPKPCTGAMGACCSMEVDLEEGEEVLPPPDPSAEHMFCLESEC